MEELHLGFSKNTRGYIQVRAYDAEDKWIRGCLQIRPANP